MIKRILNFLLVFLSVTLLFVLYTSLKTRAETGVIYVNTPSKNTNIYITQKDKASVFIGNNKAQTRLKPGTYLITASSASGFSKKIVVVEAGDVQTINLEFSSRKTVPSIDNIYFGGFEDLLNSGLNTDQLSLLKEYLFAYNPSTERIVLDTSTKTPRPRNPDTDILFITDCFVYLDGVKFKMTFEYSTDYDMKVYIFSLDGAPIYSSSDRKLEARNYFAE